MTSEFVKPNVANSEPALTFGTAGSAAADAALRMERTAKRDANFMTVMTTSGLGQGWGKKEAEGRG